ncbi:MAG: preprotein translocase subunit SecG [Epulopiscium sp.]|nr:preprotein translocase subunit SecG [Candidatus Epulonipiscium sp.]
MSALLIVMQVIYVLIGLALIWIILLQESKSAGLGAIGGAAESYWGKNKARSLEGTFERYTKIGAFIFILLALFLNILM